MRVNIHLLWAKPVSGLSKKKYVRSFYGRVVVIAHLLTARASHAAAARLLAPNFSEPEEWSKHEPLVAFIVQSMIRLIGFATLILLNQINRGTFSPSPELNASISRIEKTVTGSRHCPANKDDQAMGKRNKARDGAAILELNNYRRSMDSSSKQDIVYI